MPDLKDLYQRFQQNIPKPISAFGEAMTSPIQTAGGVLSAVGGGLKGLAGLAMDVPQALLTPTGTQLPWSSGPIVPEGQPDPKFSMQPAAAPEWKQRLAMLLNVPSFGIAHQYAENYGKTGSLDSAAFETARDLLPVREAQTLLAGTFANDPNQSLGPEEYGHNLAVGALKVLPLAKMFKGARAKIYSGVDMEYNPRRVKSITEMEATPSTLESMTAQASKVSNMDRLSALRKELSDLPHESPPEARYKIANDILQAQSDLLTERGFGPDIVREFISKAPTDALAQQMIKGMEDLARTGKPIESIAYQTIRVLEDNPAGAEGAVEVMRKYGMTPEQTAVTMPIVYDTLKRQTNVAGSTLQAYSELSNLVTARILRDHPELAEMMQETQRMMGYENHPVSMWKKMMNNYKNVEQLWRGLVTSTPTNATRNFAQGGGNAATTMFDALATGSWQYGLGKLTGQAVTLGEAYEPFLSRIRTMQEVASGGAKSIGGWIDHMASGDKSGQLTTPITSILEAINSEFPAEIRKLMNGPVQDLTTVNLMADGYKKALPNIKKAYGEVETATEGVKFATSLTNTLNTMQEMFWRKFYFVSRLRENARRFGYDTPEELIDYIKNNKVQESKYFGPSHTFESINTLDASGELGQRVKQLRQERIENYTAQKGAALRQSEVKMAGTQHKPLKEALRTEIDDVKSRLANGETWDQIGPTLTPEAAKILGGKVEVSSQAITDAVDYGLKQTFAYTPPIGNFGHAIMKVYENFPLMHTFLTPFPRFMINAMNWIVDHDPVTGFKQIASPQFRRELVAAAADPTKITNPRLIEKFAMAHTGAALWSAAYFIHNSPELTGPKYYHIKTGTDAEGNSIYGDLRPYNPLAQFMFIEHTMKAIANGETPNLTASELLEAVTGMRRLSEVPIFAFPDIIRQIDASNPDAFVNSLKPMVGQWLGGFFTPFRVTGDIAGAMGLDQAVVNKDVGGNEVVGPSVNQIPGMREALPNRVDPFTGRVSQQDHPGVRLLGPTLRHMTVLEQQVQQTGMPINDLLGNYADPEADRLVRKYIGQILGEKDSSGVSRANQIGMRLQQLGDGQSLEMRKTIIRELFQGLRESAVAAARAENPYAFIEHEIRQQPEAARPILRDRLKNFNQERVRRMMQ